MGYDYDGVVRAGITPDEGAVIITGRTWAEYDHELRQAATLWPVYLRGCGQPGDRKASALFKATMINLLGIEMFYEDDEDQAEMIADRCRVHVWLVTVDRSGNPTKVEA